MKLYRKNYKVIAEIIAANHGRFEDIDKSYYKGGRLDASEGIATQLADYFEKSNSRFDRECFLKACGL